MLTVDVEDWHQLVLRRVGVSLHGRNPAFERQMQELLAAVDAVGARATFFVLGLAAENHPEVVDAILDRGHEVACHGYSHDRVYALTRDGFRRDLDRGLTVLERLSGRRPVGYRAPCFSINRDSLWARDILAEFGFSYDSSECACPWVPRSLAPESMVPRRVGSNGVRLWELPVASIRVGGRSVPVGGASYWRWIPARTLVRVLRDVAAPNSFPALYLHPYEFDPVRLTATPPRSVSSVAQFDLRCRAAWRNAARANVLDRFAAVAANFQLLRCSDALARLDEEGRA